MKYFLIITLILTSSQVFWAQNPTPSPELPVPEATPIDDSQEFQNARSIASLTDKISALKKFTIEFPDSAHRTPALEILASARAALADQKLRLNDIQAGIDLFRQAVEDAPLPISDKLFQEVILQFPTNLFFRNQRAAAIEIAKLIEERISEDPRKLLGLAAFYLGIENGAEGKRLAGKAVELQPDLPAAYQTLAFANRLNFDLEASVLAYEKALELNPDSLVSRRSLAEMKRATGRFDEAETLYRELLGFDPSDRTAQTGLILTLFNSRKIDEAESSLKESLEAAPNNLFLLVGSAYWYSANEQGGKAVEFAKRAIELEPRYTWAHIALARGLMAQNKPLDAEKALLIARQYGNFPTLTYEIATARYAAGFYREAADELVRTFGLNDGTISVKLGGRVLKQGKSFTELLSGERQASIFDPFGAGDSAAAKGLKSLLRFSLSLEPAEKNEAEVSAAADDFANGDDKMKIHRGLFIANRLLEEKTVLPKVFEMTEYAIGKVDSGLDIVSPSATVMADELYETRVAASSKNELLLIPDIPRQTLSRILRGRIEELSGRALLAQEQPAEAAVRFKRAISILPEKSSFWRTSKWRLGIALEAMGKSGEAIGALIDSYDQDYPNPTKRKFIEAVYIKVNGSKDGLDKLIGADNTVAETEPAGDYVTENPVDGRTETETPAQSVEMKEISSETETVEESKDSDTSAATSNEKQIIIPENVPTVGKPDKVVQNEKTVAENPPTTKTESIETKTTVEKTAVPDTLRPLFEPVIIKVPTKENDKADVPSLKPDKDAALEIQPAKTEPNPNVRPRIVSSNEPAETSLDQKVDQCRLKLSQDSVLLLNDGGSLGIFAGFEGVGGDLTKITAISDSPQDVSVEFQKDIGVLSERAFFIIRSASTKTGLFSINFESDCGKKVVAVTVR